MFSFASNYALGIPRTPLFICCMRAIVKDARPWPAVLDLFELFFLDAERKKQNHHGTSTKNQSDDQNVIQPHNSNDSIAADRYPKSNWL